MNHEPTNEIQLDSAYYPLNLNGPLCPMLDNDDLFQALYSEKRTRDPLKDYIKKHARHFNVGIVVNPEKARVIARQIFNDPKERQHIMSAADSACLHEAIWHWCVRYRTDISTHFTSVCDRNGTRIFLRMDAWPDFIASANKNVLEENDRRYFVLVTLAFAMLQPEARHTLVSGVLNVFPEFRELVLGDNASAATERVAAANDSSIPGNDGAEANSLAEQAQIVPQRITTRDQPNSLACTNILMIQFINSAKVIESTRVEFDGWRNSLSGLFDMSITPNTKEYLLYNETGKAKTDSYTEACRSFSKLYNEIYNNYQRGSCRFCDGLAEAMAQPALTFRQVEHIASKLNSIASESQRLYSEMIEEVIQLRNKLGYLKEVLGESHEIAQEPESSSLCEVMIMISLLRTEIHTIEEKARAFSANYQAELAAELSKLQTTYEMTAALPEAQALVKELLHATNCGFSADKVAELKQSLAELRIYLESCPACYSISKASQIAIDSNLNTSKVLTLVGALLAHSRDKTALIVLNALQYTQPVEHLNKSETAQFMQALTAGALSPSLALCLRRRASLFIDQPWLNALAPDLLNDDKTRIRLGTCLILFAHAGLIEWSRSMIMRFNLDNPLGHVSSEARRCVSNLSHGRSLSLSSESSPASASQTYREINDLMRKEHGHYVHLPVKSGKYVVGFQQSHLFPALERLWNRTEAAAKKPDNIVQLTQELDALDARDFYLKMAKDTGFRDIDNPYYTKKLISFINQAVALMRSYVRLSQQHDGIQTINLANFLREVKGAWEGVTWGTSFESNVTSLVDAKSTQDETIGSEIRTAWLLTDPELLRIASSLVQEHCELEDSSTRPHGASLRDLLDGIAADSSAAEVTASYSNSGLFLQAAILARTANLSDTDIQQYEDAHKLRVEEFQSRCSKLKDHETDAYLARLAEPLSLGRYSAAEAILSTAERQVDAERAVERESIKIWAEKLVTRLNKLRDKAYESHAAEIWRQDLLVRSSRLEHIVREIKSAWIKPSDHITQRTNKALEILEFCTQNRVNNFDELDKAIQSLIQNKPDEVIGTIIVHPIDSDKRDQRAHVLELWSQCKVLNNATLPAWRELFQCLAEEIQVYRDVTNKERVEYISLGDSTHLKAFSTRFKRAITRFLDRPIRFYLLPEVGTDADSNMLAIRDTILSCEPRSEYHVILSPGQLDKRIFARLNREINEHDHCLIDSELAQHILNSASPDMAMRQAMLKAADIMQSSPFRAEGFVDADRDLFVGRQSELGRLLKPGHWFLCGGRRMGKTSLLHATQAALREKGWKVTYLDMGYLLPGTDPDVVVCQDIAGDQQWARPHTVDDFRRSMIEALRAGPVAVLLDEMDHYIEQSHQTHGAGAFPFMRCLRALAQSDTKGKFKVIVAGFKRLYYEMQPSLNPTKDTSYPFRQFMTQLPFGQFEYSEAAELIETGLLHTMGIPLEEGVSRAIFTRATGHPAFLQRFCQCLLERQTPDRNNSSPLQIRLRDVEDVYSDSLETSDTSAFISYVDSTLGLNLSALGRVILLLMAIDIGPNGDHEKAFSQNELESLLSEYCTIVNVHNPDQTIMNRTLEFLVMSGMLDKDNTFYRMAFPSYIDILFRLEETDKNRIWMLIKEYDENERNKIV